MLRGVRGCAVIATKQGIPFVADSVFHAPYGISRSRKLSLLVSVPPFRGPAV